MKRLAALLIAIFLVLMLIPSSALADENNYVKVDGTILDPTVYYINDGSVGTAANYNYHFDEDNHTLYLRNLNLTYTGNSEAFQIVYQRDAAFTVNLEGICTINAANGRAFGLTLGEDVDSITFEGDGTLRVNASAMLRANQTSIDPEASIVFDDIALNFDISRKVFGGKFNLTLRDVNLTLDLESDDVPAQAIYSNGDMTIESSDIEATFSSPGGVLSGLYSETGNINIKSSGVELSVPSTEVGQTVDGIFAKNGKISIDDSTVSAVIVSNAGGVVNGIVSESGDIDIINSSIVDIDIDVTDAGADELAYATMTETLGTYADSILNIDSSEFGITMRGENSTWDTFSYLTCNNIIVNDSTVNLVGTESLEGTPRSAIYTGGIEITGASDFSIDDVNFESGITSIDSIDINLTKGGRVFVRTAMPADDNYLGILSQTGNINLQSGNYITTPVGGKIETYQPAPPATYIAGALDANNGGYVIEITASTTPANPATGENSFVFVGIALALAAGCGIVLTKKKQQA